MTDRANSIRLLSRQDVEETYGISKRFLERATSQGEGPTIVRIGRLVRYRPTDIESWIAANSDDGSGK